MKCYAAISIFAAVGLGALAGAWMGGGVFHHLFSFALGVLIGVPVAIALIFVLIVRRKPDNSDRVCDGLATAAVSYLVFAGLFCASGRYVFERREAEVRSYVGAVIPMLDAYKQKHGRYPESIDGITDRKLPYYFRQKQAYSSNGDSFTFYYETPDSIMGGMTITDQDRSWSIAD